MFAASRGASPSDHELLNAFIQHQLAESRQHVVLAPRGIEVAAAEAVAAGAHRRPRARGISSPILPRFRRYADNPTPGHPFEQLNAVQQVSTRTTFTTRLVMALLGLTSTYAVCFTSATVNTGSHPEECSSPYGSVG